MQLNFPTAKHGGVMFTPLHANSGKRLFLEVSAEDYKAVFHDGRGPGLKATVKELGTNKKFKVYGQPCTLPNCYCDLAVKEVP